MDTATHQRLAVFALVGHCEQIAGSGVLAESIEQKLRVLIASTLSAFRMPSEPDATDRALAAIAAAIDSGEIADPDVVCNVVQIGDHAPESYVRIEDVMRREMGARQ